MINEQLIQLVQKDLDNISKPQVTTVLNLMNEGNTVPFIARYRKEMTGSLDEVQIQAIETGFKKAKALQERKESVLKSLAEQGVSNAALEQKIHAAESLQDVEDLYLPYKQKRQTKAAIAKSRGLEPFARWILTFPSTSLAAEAETYVNPDKELPTTDEVLDGAHEILAETFGELASLRTWVRGFTQRTGRLVVAAKAKAEELDELGVYRQFYDFSEAVNKLSATRILAINRGEKAKILGVKLQVDNASIEQYGHFKFIGQRPQSEATDFVEAAYLDAYKRFVGPAIEREIRAGLTESANAQSIQVFGQNLYHLLMQAPIKGRVVLGFDPAYRTGCKLAVVDENGKFLAKAVIYPHKPAPEAKRQAAMGEFLALLERYHVTMVALGNGTASRESEAFVAEALKQLPYDCYFVIVSEAGASVYSASQEARDEFPDLQVEQRSAISIARRLQDPLAELVKINPESVGVGQYQHDLPAKELADEVDHVVERAVNQVGINVNTASYQLLARISGLSNTIAKNIVAYRDENGRYHNRLELKKVPRLGPKAFEQSVGFLRIIDGSQPLDNTDIHPESYPVAEELLAAAHLELSDVGQAGIADQLAKVKLDEFVSETVGKQTLNDIMAGLVHPGRDLRDTMDAPLLRQDVLTMEDLQVGMKLEGTVRNVVDFGAFVDIGVKHDGLVHLSRMAKKYVKDPNTVVAIGDVVTVWVDKVDLQRERIQLTMVEPKNS